MNPMISFLPMPRLTGMTRRQRKAAKAKRLRQQQAVRVYCMKVLPRHVDAIARAQRDALVYGVGVVEI